MMKVCDLWDELSLNLPTELSLLAEVTHVFSASLAKTKC
jgi:hypothetical protein